MLALIQFNLVTLLVAGLIGIATGWWTFGRSRREQVRDQVEEDPDRL